MANLNTVQDHLETLKTGTPEQKKQKLTPESIADVRRFIADERANRVNGSHYSLEPQFHEWEDLIKKYESERGQITAATATATASTAATVTEAATLKKTNDGIDSVMLMNLKKSLEKEIASPVTVESLQKLLAKIDTEKSVDNRNMIVTYLWSRLATAGYIMTLQSGKVSLQNDKDQKNAELLEATIQAHLGAGKLSLAELQRVILIGSGSFGEYVQTQKVNIKNITTEGYVTHLTATLSLDLTKGTPEQKVKLINASKATPDEKALLISYVKGGYTGYALAPDAERQLQLRENSQEFMLSPQYASAVTAVDKVNPGATQAEKQKMQQGGKKEELTFETFMDNPMRAVSKYPWTSLALVAGSIWKFGFGKTIFGLLAGVIGIKAINEIGTTTGIGKDIRDGLEKGYNEMTGKAKQVGQAAQDAVNGNGSAAPVAAPANTPASSFEISKLSDMQKKGVGLVQGNKSLLDDIQNFPKKAGKEKQNADLATYLTVVHKDSLQNITLDKIIYTSDHDQSIFSDEVKSQFPTNGDIPDNVSRYLLKKVLRSYIGINTPLSPSGTNKKEGVDTLEEFKKKYPENTWKNKTLKDLVNEIHK